MSIDVNVQNDLVIVTESSEDIVVNVSNAAGPTGPAGANGVGVPVGGTTGQVLKKFTNTNYDTYWAADASGLTSVGLSVPTGLTVTNSPLTTNGTIAVGLASGYSIPTTASQATWNTAYNDSIVSAAVTGTTTKTLTLNQQDGGSVTASWSDLNTDAVTSVFGRTGAVIATEGDYTLTQLGDVTLTSPTNGQVLKYNGTTWVNNTDTDTGLTSVGLTMPSAFSVANSPLTSNGTIAVTGAGLATQYIRGDGQLATFPSTASGGSSVNYYLNGSVNASVAGYKQLDNNAIVGGGTDFTLVGNGLIAQFLTDAGNPNRIQIPGGAWNFEMYFQVSSAGGNQKFYIELHKYDGSTFTLIASSSAVPEEITGGTSIDLYLTSLAVPTTTLLTTDRLAIRVYIVDNAVGRTITLHTENTTLCEIITTFSGGVSSLNGLSANTQYFATGTSGSDFNISSLVDTHTFNLPTASATNRGALSSADWGVFNSKVGGTGVSGQVAYWNGTNSQTGSNNLFWDAANNRLGIGTNTPSELLSILGATASGAGISLQNADGLGGKIIADNSRLYFYSNNSTLIYSITNSKIRINDGNGASIGFELGSGGSISQNGNGGGLTFVDTKAYLNNGLVISSSNLLVGTTTDAGEKLQVNGNIYITSGVVYGASSYSDAAVNKGMSFVGTNVLFNNGGERMRLDNAGNLALGVVPSAWTNCKAIDISTIGSVFADGFSQNNQAGFATNAYRAGAAVWYYKGTAAATYYAQDLGTHKWFNAPSGTAGNAISFTQAMTLTSGGNLLVGTTTDTGEKLQVNGTSKFSLDVAISGSTGLRYASGDLGFTNTASGGQYGIYTLGTSNPTMFFDHRATGNTGTWAWRSGTGGATTAMTLSNAGAATFSSSVTAGGGTNNASAILQADSSTKGFLPPRMTNAQRTAISSPAVGLIVYCTDATEGLYQYINNAWVNLTGVVTNRQTASYTLALGDSNDLVEMNVATANNLTVPLNSSVAFPIGTKIDVAQYGAGQTTVVATSGVTVRSAGGALKIVGQYSAATLVKIGTDEWYLIGNITT